MATNGAAGIWLQEIGGHRRLGERGFVISGREPRAATTQGNQA
jgi:hypothetical protein